MEQRTWHGSPLTWRTFRREMSWWMSSLDALATTSNYKLAARWLLRQSGAVRQRGEEFSPEDLAYGPAEYGTDPETGDSLELSPAGPFQGLNILLDKCGELRTQLYIKMSRRRTSLRLYSSRFRTAV